MVMSTVIEMTSTRVAYVSSVSIIVEIAMQLSIVAYEYIDHNFQSSGFAASPSSEKNLQCVARTSTNDVTYM